jgi:hypothetical protein
MHHLLLGSAILGSGGGGALAQGRAIVDEVLTRGGTFELLSANEVAPDALVGCPYLCGSVTCEVEESVPSYLEAVRDAHRAAERHLGARLSALYPTELGAANTAIGMATAALAGLPSIDGDPSGRAVPEIQHTAMAVNGLPIAPMCVSDGMGNQIVVSHVSDDLLAEKIIRSIAAASPHGAVAVLDHVIAASDLPLAIIEGTLTRAIELGRRCAAAAPAEAAESIAAATDALVVFRGVVTEATSDVNGGFTVGDIALRGEGSFAGSMCRVWYKNENLAAWRDGEVVASVPDIICLLDETTGEPIVNPGCVVGSAVSVLALPAPDLWTTVRGLELLGPRTFDLDFDYIPAQRLADPADD